MKKLSRKPLEVRQETIRQLGRPELAPVVGGAIVASGTLAVCGGSGGGCSTSGGEHQRPQ